MGFTPSESELTSLSDLLSLADALADGDIPEPPNGWDWDTNNFDGRKTGWSASADEISGYTEELQAEATEQVDEITERLLADDEGLSAWEKQAATILILLLLASYSTGRGPDSAMDLAIMQARLRNQLSYLRGFSEAVATGDLTPAQIKARARYYPIDSSLAFDQGLRSAYRAAGWLWELNVLSATEHCRGCLNASALGWQPIGTLPAIGTRECRFNDACHWEFSNLVERPADNAFHSFKASQWDWLRA